MYGDNTSVFIEERNINTLYDRAQNELTNLAKWLSANNLTLNIKKQSTVYNVCFKQKKKTRQ